MISTNTIFWTQIITTVGFAVTALYLYRLLVEQNDATIQGKEATIQGLKDNIAYLKDQLADAKQQSPDVLAERLAKRTKLLEEELKKLGEDKSSTEAQVKAKEAELASARSEAEALTRQVLHARELLQDYQCPHCGAPLLERGYHSESVEYMGREMDVDHDWTSYECGFEVVDGLERHPCKAGAAPVTHTLR